MTSKPPAFVAYSTEDRQWDGRVNVQEDDYLATIVENAMMEFTSGKLKYVLVSGVEIGTRPYQTDYQIRHIHLALIFNNRASKSAIMKNFGIKEGNGYYLVPRNRELPYSGWREHHIKPFSKVDPEKSILYEAGELPKDAKAAVTTLRSNEEKKRKVDEIIIDLRKLISEDKEEEAFTKYPRNYVIYGSRIKAMVQQKANFFGDRSHPHIFLHGYPGSGKTSILKWIYPNTYKKDLSNRFFDLYDDKVHSHIMLEDLDHENVEKLGIQFLKTLCDEGGFPIDQKYKTPQLARATILITSNFTIPEIIPDDTKNIETTKAALYRRFWHVNIQNFLRLLGVKLIDKFERKRLQSQGNEDPSAIYIAWDYMTDMPTGLPLLKPEEYQQMIKDEFYK